MTNFFFSDAIRERVFRLNTDTGTCGTFVSAAIRVVHHHRRYHLAFGSSPMMRYRSRDDLSIVYSSHTLIIFDQASRVRTLNSLSSFLLPVRPFPSSPFTKKKKKKVERHFERKNRRNDDDLSRHHVSPKLSILAVRVLPRRLCSIIVPVHRDRCFSL